MPVLLLPAITIGLSALAVALFGEYKGEKFGLLTPDEEDKKEDQDDWPGRD
jgi:hypothetical protein